MTTEFFYANLPAFDNFDDCTDSAQFVELPDDWHVVIADIAGSTQAIAAGRYRDVNAIGVAAIVAVNNAVKPTVVPFVFGGDGATFAIHESLLPRVLPVLRATADMAIQQFDLELRVGTVPVSALRAHGADIALGKWRVNAHYTQAMLAGDGWTLADRWIKDSPQWRPHVTPAVDVDFSGFECRWNEIRSPHGETISLLVQALPAQRAQQQAIYRDVLHTLNAIYGNDAAHHPISLDHLRLSFSWRKLSLETRIRQYNETSPPSRYHRRLLFLAAAGRYLMARRINTEQTQWGDYKSRLRANTDYRKFDDMLRMVVAGNSAQRAQLDAYLQRCCDEGKLAYGLHVADAALITCVVSDYNHRHWHFLDGANGGYAMAAVQLKQRLKTFRVDG